MEKKGYEFTAFFTTEGKLFSEPVLTKKSEIQTIYNDNLIIMKRFKLIYKKVPLSIMKKLRKVVNRNGNGIYDKIETENYIRKADYPNTYNRKNRNRL